MVKNRESKGIIMITKMTAEVIYLGSNLCCKRLQKLCLTILENFRVSFDIK